MILRSWKAACLGLALVVLATSAWADSPDAWLTTKAKLALLTTEGVKVTAVNVDTVNGNVTLHGKVKTEAEKEKAAAAVKKVDGVKDVRNLLQVVPESVRESVKVADTAVKEKLEASLKADASLEGVKVASVNNGVVLLSGKTDTLEKKLQAVETAWSVDGVQQVRSEILAEHK